MIWGESNFYIKFSYSTKKYNYSSFEDYLNEQNEPSQSSIPRKSSLMEMSIILRTNNQDEKIESVLKRICDPSSFNQLHNLKKI